MEGLVERNEEYSVLHSSPSHEAHWMSEKKKVWLTWSSSGRGSGFCFIVSQCYSNSCFLSPLALYVCIWTTSGLPSTRAGSFLFVQWTQDTSISKRWKCCTLCTAGFFLPFDDHEVSGGKNEEKDLFFSCSHSSRFHSTWSFVWILISETYDDALLTFERHLMMLRTAFRFMMIRTGKQVLLNSFHATLMLG